MRRSNRTQFEVTNIFCPQIISHLRNVYCKDNKKMKLQPERK